MKHPRVWLAPLILAAACWQCSSPPPAGNAGNTENAASAESANAPPKPEAKKSDTPMIADVALNALKKGKIAGADSDLRSIATALRSYAQDHQGAYPETEEFSELRGYLCPQYITQLPLNDFWGNPYHYMGGGSRAELRSAGPDRDYDTDDDIVFRP